MLPTEKERHSAMRHFAVIFVAIFLVGLGAFFAMCLWVADVSAAENLDFAYVDGTDHSANGMFNNHGQILDATGKAIFADGGDALTHARFYLANSGGECTVSGFQADALVDSTHYRTESATLVVPTGDSNLDLYWTDGPALDTIDTLYPASDFTGSSPTNCFTSIKFHVSSGDAYGGAGSYNVGDSGGKDLNMTVWGETTVSCGDGVIDSPEECDDSGAVEGDGCSELCFVEEGWWCAGQPSACELDIYDIAEDPHPYSYGLSFSTHEAMNCHVHSGLASPPQGYVDADEGETATVAHNAVVYPDSLGVPLVPSTLYYYDVHCGDDESGVKEVTTLAAPPDTRNAPSVIILEPDEGDHFGNIHDPFAVLARSDIDMAGFPDLAVTFDVEVYNEEETESEIIWTRSALPTNTHLHVDGTPYYSILKPVTCGFVEATDYSIRVRVQVPGFESSAWTAKTYFDFTGTPLEEAFNVDDLAWCADPDGLMEHLICGGDAFYDFLFTPSAGSRRFLAGAMSGWSDDNGILPFASLVGVTVSNVPYCPLSTFASSKFGYAGTLTMPSFDLCDKVEDAAGLLNAIPAVGVGFEVVIACFGLACVVGLFKFAFGSD